MQCADSRNNGQRLNSRRNQGTQARDR
jgi:hypothetical protein